MVMRKVLRRDRLLRWTGALPSCVMAMEACGGASLGGVDATGCGAVVAKAIRAGISQERGRTTPTVGPTPAMVCKRRAISLCCACAAIVCRPN